MIQIKNFFYLAFLLCSQLLFVCQANSQDMPPRYATLELFTNTPCPICGSQNPGLFNRLANYEGQYHLVSFYPGKPYSSCIFYQANISENTSRYQFYTGNVFGSPTVALNGIDFKNSSGVTNMVMDNLTGGQSWLKVRVDETEGTTRTVNIELEDFEGGSLTTGTLVAVVVEKLIMYNAPNGETMHHNVFRQFLGPVNGEAVDMSSGLATMTYEYTVDDAWDADQVYVIAWLADPGTNEVFNSGTKFDPDFTTSVAPVTTQSLTLYPNPASDEVFVRMPSEIVNAEIRVFDAQGRMIKTVLSDSSPEVSISVDAFATGKYILQFQQGSVMYTGSFEVVR